MNVTNTIRKPVVTEKSSLLQEKNIYAFWVDANATKVDVKMAIKALYGVDVVAVRMVTVAGKFRQIKKGTMNKRKENHKAYITLKKGVKLETGKFEKTDKETKVKLAAPKPGKIKSEKAAKPAKMDKKPAKVKKTQ